MSKYITKMIHAEKGITANVPKGKESEYEARGFRILGDALPAGEEVKKYRDHNKILSKENGDLRVDLQAKDEELVNLKTQVSEVNEIKEQSQAKDQKIKDLQKNLDKAEKELEKIKKESK